MNSLKEKISALKKQNESLVSLEQTIDELMQEKESPALFDRIASIDSSLSDIESVLADVVSALEKTDTSKAILAAVDAIKSLKQGVSVNIPEQNPPTVNVQVNPTPIVVEAVMPEVPAPIIHLMDNPRRHKNIEWEVIIPNESGRGVRRMTIIRKEV